MNGSGELAKPDLWTLRNHGNVLHSDRRTVLGDDDRPFDVLYAVDQSHGAHVNLLQTFLYETSACVHVIVGELLLDLGQAQSVSHQFVWVHTNLVFAGGAAEAGNVNNIRHRFEILFDDPVFNGLQFHRVICRIGAVQREEINLANRAPVRAHLRIDARR